jgi:hypothetical protein
MRSAWPPLHWHSPFAGIQFFYRRTAPRDWDTLKQPRIPKAKTLPDVLSPDEVRRLINAVRTPHNRTYFWTVYSLGLRLHEGLHLQVGDIDAARKMVHVHRGKGAKDRYVPLPERTLTLLREYKLAPIEMSHTRRASMSFLISLAMVGCIAGCETPTDSVANDVPSGRGQLLGEIHCVAAAQAGTLECNYPAVRESAANYALYGLNQLKLQSSNVAYDTTTLIFGFDVTVQNLLAHPTGTPDGTTVTGLKVFYDSGPTATSFIAPYDTGTVSVAKADGSENFTKANQPFHFYNQTLSPQEVTPAKRWELRVPRSVDTFSFTVKVFTRVPSEPAVPPQVPDTFLISDDSLASLHSPARAVLSHSRLRGPYPQSIVLVSFHSSASADERQAAVNVVNGEVIGGYGRTFYVVLIPPDASGNTLWSAISELEDLPQVEYAGPDLLYRVQPYHVKPTDGPGWSGGDWILDDSLAAGENWASEAISAPLGWGCSTGHSALSTSV